MLISTFIITTLKEYICFLFGLQQMLIVPGNSKLCLFKIMSQSTKICTPIFAEIKKIFLVSVNERW